jgi:hypothetical protein
METILLALVSVLALAQQGGNPETVIASFQIEQTWTGLMSGMPLRSRSFLIAVDRLRRRALETKSPQSCKSGD